MPNRLINETSPYLLQHAHNPVEWYAWGDEGLKRAKAENKIILVSIGYSACHWCHVMERESFENEETAALMNEFFINIKIDREERPDLDQVYMDAVQLIAGSGGWPLNVFLTPDAKPFYGGTYFPPFKAYNRSSWTDVIVAINHAWKERPSELIEQAENLTNHLKNPGIFNSVEQSSNPFSIEDLHTLSKNLMKSADTAWGGFGNAPKFPQTFSIGFLLRQAWLENGQKLTEAFFESPLRQSPFFKQAMLSLDKMILGGIYDQLDGGFARYSTDARWMAPHFEKMLYDNALLIGVIAEAYQLSGKEMYGNVIRQTMEFIRREWQDTDGGFFSAFDADSEGEEGKFYTWEKEELASIIQDPAALELFCAFYSVQNEGNWEGTNILWVQQPPETFSRARNLSVFEVSEKLAQCRQLLVLARNKRPRPLLDDKKLLGWNAMMITACCKAWAAIADSSWLQMAIKAAEFIEEKMKSKNGKYFHNYKNNKAANPAFLDDLACYIEALCKLQEATGNHQYLVRAIELTEQVISDFSNENDDLFYFTPAFQQDIIFRKKEVYDGATPSGNSVMAWNLFYLGTLTDNPAWKQKSIAAISQMTKLITSYPTSFGNWAMLLQQLIFNVKELAIVGESHQQEAARVLSVYWPNKILQHAATKNESFPLLAGKEVQTGQTGLFLCFNYSCMQPVYDVQNLFALAEQVSLNTKGGL